MSNTIHIITNPIAFTPYMTHWREAFSDYGYDVKVYPGNDYSVKRADPGEMEFKAAQLLQLFQDFSIKDNDIVIFADAWNFGACFLNNFRVLKKIKFKMFGFWLFNPFDSQSKIYNIKGDDRNWVKRQIAAVYGAYDYNCYLTEEISEDHKVWQRFNTFRTQITKSYGTGYPFEHLFPKELPNLEEKENIVLIPMNPLDPEQRTFLKVIETEFPDYKFHYLQKLKPSRSTYLKLLKKAKIMFFNRKWEYDPTMIVEGMRYGVVPLMPLLKVQYRLMFSELYQYDPQILDPQLRLYNRGLWMIKNRRTLVGKMRDMMNNHGEYCKRLISDSDPIIEQYFSNKKFLELLNDDRK